MSKGFWYCASDSVSGYPITPGDAGDVLTSNGADAYPTYQPSGGGTTIPAGIIVMWSGLIVNIPSGWLLCDGTNGTPDLRNLFIKGADGDPGSTGGAATHTPAGSVSAPTFSGNAVTSSAVSAGTPAGSVAAPTSTVDGSNQILVIGVIAADANGLKTDTTTAHTAVLQAYDVNGTTYRTFGLLTNGDVPSFTVSQPAGGILAVIPPTSDPGVSGAIWNDTGTLKIST